MGNNCQSFDSMADVFQILNEQQVCYAVLRNYDNLLSEEMYMDGHGDVDLVCEDSQAMAEVLNAYPHKHHVKNGRPDGVHYYIYVRGHYVSLDLRYVGDGYYCAPWQQEMLRRRILHDGFYVLDKEDHFYSLIYHAVFQKEHFSVDYQERLSVMASDLGLTAGRGQAADFVLLLEAFMKAQGYYYCYPKDKHVPLRRRHIQDQSLLKVHQPDFWRHFFFDSKVSMIGWMVKVKHWIKN